MSTHEKRRPHRRQPLNLFQFFVLRAISDLGDDAYGMAIEDYLSASTKMKVDLAMVYMVIQRLISVGYVSKGGKAQRHVKSSGTREVQLYRLTSTGVQEMMATKKLLEHFLTFQKK